ncbi:MAG: histidine--tRNA ligase [Oligoflexia bacterium]|nr:histidine--tRNA ligase [Oligoflexia bacterium]
MNMNKDKTSSSLSKQPYKGTRDLFPPLKRTQDYMFSKMREVAHLFGYEPYDGPLLEEVELYKAKSGEELINEQIYSFTDRGARFVAIRPEMTPTLARMVAQAHKEMSKPIRWYAIPNLMRYEKPQKGRLREHWQFNVDIFGAPQLMGELEILELAIVLLQSFGASDNDFEILLNDRQVVDDIFKKLLNLDSEIVHRLYKIVDKSQKVPKETLDHMIAELNIGSRETELFLDYLQIKSFEELFLFLDKNNLQTTKNNLEKFSKLLKDINIFKFIKYDPTIVRGLDYYTGIVFEIYDKHPDNRRALCGGGSYANLLQIFNEAPLPGVGFGLGDVTFKEFLSLHKLLPDFSKPEVDFLISYQTSDGEKQALQLANSFRSLGLKVVCNLQVIKIAKCFPLAERLGAKFVVLIGEDEIKNNFLVIKNLQTQEQHKLELNLALDSSNENIKNLKTKIKEICKK